MTMSKVPYMNIVSINGDKTMLKNESNNCLYPALSFNVKDMLKGIFTLANKSHNPSKMFLYNTLDAFSVIKAAMFAADKLSIEPSLHLCIQYNVVDSEDIITVNFSKYETIIEGYLTFDKHLTINLYNNCDAPLVIRHKVSGINVLNHSFGLNGDHHAYFRGLNDLPEFKDFFYNFKTIYFDE